MDKGPRPGYNNGMSATKKLKAKAEVPKREWVEFEIEVDEQGTVSALKWNALGCHNLIEAAGRAANLLLSRKLENQSWPGAEHWDLLLSEVFGRLQGKFQLPREGEELCHCRRIQAAVVDQAIVMGAHTPEKVKAWTAASSGCGTCRPEVEKLICFRLKKSS